MTLNLDRAHLYNDQTDGKAFSCLSKVLYQCNISQDSENNYLTPRPVSNHVD